MMKGHFRPADVLLATLLLSLGLSFAQTTSGQISGRVVDSSGAVIPNASVTLTNELTS